MMRVDEEYAKKSIKVYLESISYPPFEIVPGGDPPDYYCVDSSGNKTPLEITTAESIYKDENEKSKKRTSTETLIKFCNQLDNKYKNLVPKGKSIMLVFKVPVKNFNKFNLPCKNLNEGTFSYIIMLNYDSGTNIERPA